MSLPFCVYTITKREKNQEKFLQNVLTNKKQCGNIMMFTEREQKEVTKLLDAKAIGGRIKALREDMNISRSELCRDAGISLSALTMYETGQRVPRDEVKLRLSRCLNTSLEGLFYAQ